MAEAHQPRRLGTLGLELGPIGVGTWAIGGPFSSGEGYLLPTGTPIGYGAADDAESIRAIHCAVEHGAVLYDTSDAYGTGHAERILGKALKARRGDVVIATKFGNTYHEPTRQLTGINVSPTYIRQACEASLKRLQIDCIDLYQLHIGDLPIDRAEEVADVLDGLCDEGLIRSYGWSTDDPARAEIFARRERAVAVQFDFNIFQDAPEMLETCARHEVTAIARVPLAMGFLSGKFTGRSALPSDDIRSKPPEWLRYFEEGGRASAQWVDRLNSVKEVLASDGRTLAQGALCWIWARDDRTVSVPGARTVAQVTENLGASDFGPFNPDQMDEIDRLLHQPA